MSKKRSYNDIRKIRYQVLRDLGYSVAEAQALRSRSLSWIDVSSVRVSKKTGKVLKGQVYKRNIEKSNIDSYTERAKTYKNDTVLSRWGMITQDPRYRDDTARIVYQLMKTYKLSSDQAHYFLYFMLSNNLTFDEAKDQLLSSREFEMYDKNKFRRK